MDRLEVLRELAAGPPSRAERDNAGGAEPVDPVLAARQRRAARQQKRQQAARASGTRGEAARGADTVAATEAGPRMPSFASGWSNEVGEDGEEEKQGEDEFGGEAGPRMQSFGSGWSIEVDEEDEEEEGEDGEEGGNEDQWQEASGSEVTEELYNLNSGWSLEALGASDDDQARLHNATHIFSSAVERCSPPSPCTGAHAALKRTQAERPGMELLLAWRRSPAAVMMTWCLARARKRVSWAWRRRACCAPFRRTACARWRSSRLTPRSPTTPPGRATRLGLALGRLLCVSARLIR